MSEQPVSEQQHAIASDCAKEPIHIPGAIQPHGYLFVLAPTGEILQASANAEALFGVDVERLRNTRITEWLASYESSWNLKSALARLGEEREVAVELELSRDGSLAWFHAIAHQTDQGIIVEFEPAQAGQPSPVNDTAPILRNVMTHLEEADSVLDLCHIAAREVRRLTGFDRVKVYRFDEDWHGEVIAEERAEHMPTYLHHHFPASDIPAQARRLYETVPLRLIADVGYVPVPVVPEGNPVTNTPLDMSHCVLRSVSPVHIEYLKNMDVGASMSVSLLRKSRLWGMIACHHDEAHHVPFHIRAACQLIGQVVSLLLGEKEEGERQAEVLQARTHTAALLRSVLRSDDVVQGLVRPEDDLLRLMHATGACVARNGRITAVGSVPDEEALRLLVRWIQDEHADEMLFTAALSTVYPEGYALQTVASGVCAIPLDVPDRVHVIWMRPERPQLVKWAGNPEKPVVPDDEAPRRLHPRRSFAAWEQELRGRAQPWTTGDHAIAERLRTLIAEVVD